jgi:arylsulfatase A-like enzyme
MRGERPNLLLFMPETLRQDAVFGPAGTTAMTPNMEALAEEGVRFDNCFVQHTVCSPSRCSMFTGQYPHTWGHRTLTHLLRAQERNLFRDLKEAGYVTQCFGKNDLLAQEAVPLSFDSVALRVKPAPGPSREWPWPPEHKHYKSFYLGRLEKENAKGFDWACVQSALEFLDEKRDGPFCLFLPLALVHPPYRVEEPYFSRHDRSAVAAPIPPEHGGKRRYVRMMYESYGLNRLEEADFREIRATYYGMTSRVDAYLGEVIRKLKERGLYEKTAIFVFSDHGDYAGDYGLTEKWWTGFEEGLIHTPLIMRIPGYPATAPRRALVEMVDLYPTVLEAAGVEARHHHFGKSLLPLVRGETDFLRAAVFAEGGWQPEEKHCLEPVLGGIYHEKTHLPRRDPLVAARAAAVRTESHKYIYCPEEFDELYDLRADPRELVNLAPREEARAAREELRELLLRWFTLTSDAVPFETDKRGF